MRSNVENCWLVSCGIGLPMSIIAMCIITESNNTHNE